MELDFTNLVTFFQNVIQDCGGEGKILACIVIPDHSKLYDFERKREHVIMRYEMFRDDPPPLSWCFGSEAYLEDDAFERRIDQIDFQVDKQLTKHLKGTNTAFLLLDSLHTVLNIKNTVT